jgi:ribosomal protein S18 acetylase RimI-like enzyme
MLPAMIMIEQLTPDMAGQLKTVRLSALLDTPSAFGSTFAKESQLSDEDWLNRVTKWNSEDSVCYLAMAQDEACGIVAGKVVEHDPRRAYVLSMWVSPAYRRHSLGARLVNAIQLWATNAGVSELILTVVNTNSVAIDFYRKLGFVFTGKTEPYPNDPALFEYEMVKTLRIS